MSGAVRSILLLGKSNVGKTHYGAQLLKRLILGQSSLRMIGAASNLQPFEDAMNSLSEGRATGHTPAGTYVESVWPVGSNAERAANLIWPDYGGEQVRTLIADHKVPIEWRDRVQAASDWILLVRLQAMHTDEDVFSRPLSSLGKPNVEEKAFRLSDQARIIELLQILLHLGGYHSDMPLASPTCTVLLSCWDEIGSTNPPMKVLQDRLPMLAAFFESNWESPYVFGLSALERSLSQTEADSEYATKGAEQFGYVVLPDGTKSADITLPITHLFAQTA